MLGLVLVGLLVLIQLPPVTEAYLRASRWLQGYVERSGAWGVVAFLLFSAFSVLLGPFTSAPMVPAAVLAWGRTATLFLLLGGWMIGNIGAYAIGRYGAVPVLRRFVPWERIETWKARVPRRRMMAAAIVARLTLPAEVGYAYGALHFDFVWYVVITLLAEIPTALLVIYASEALLQHRTMQLVTIGVIAAGALAVALLLRGTLRRHEHDDRLRRA